ncbi:calponin homology domain-containing protein [Mycotypha africana]|uniref:calponin domain-containing protein n=1 Tax=Mycotypha africana TaxID=64632 RepID=UPI002300D52F|nr:calponin domain-containing protein [Mycotypha africana]KAI8992012.1 calponin homology domain-containing protein [Mycotypha africana]
MEDEETPLYGIDKEIHARIDAKYSVEREKEARQWIEDLIGEKFPSEDFAESLKDGTILCKLNSHRVIEKLKPGSGKFKQSRLPFVQMENISIFLRGAEALGVPKHDLFQTIDLYEKKNMTQVVDAIFSLSRYGYKAGTSPDYLGPKLADKQQAAYSKEAAAAAAATYNTYQYGYTGGANQSGMTFGKRREVVGSDPNSQYK